MWLLQQNGLEKDTEKLTRRNMKECVSEYIQTLCFEDVAFARLTMQPKKNMIHCFQYINRKAYEYVQDEMKVNGVGNRGGMQCYASDIPDDLCILLGGRIFPDSGCERG